MTIPILKALAELEDAEKRAKYHAENEFFGIRAIQADESTWHDLQYRNELRAMQRSYFAGAASLRPAVEAVKVLVEAMEAIEIIGRKLDPVYIETWNAQAALAKEALADAARILGGGK